MQGSPGISVKVVALDVWRKAVGGPIPSALQAARVAPPPSASPPSSSPLLPSAISGDPHSGPGLPTRAGACPLPS